MPIDKVLHQPKGYATVTFMMPEHAVKAYTELDGTVFCGRMLHLLPAKTEKLENDDDDGAYYTILIIIIHKYKIYNNVLLNNNIEKCYIP